MAIKSTVTKRESTNTGRSYPWIGECENGSIILFTAKDQGVKLRGDSGFMKVGEFGAHAWECHFEPFTGQLTISNAA